MTHSYQGCERAREAQNDSKNIFDENVFDDIRMQNRSRVTARRHGHPNSFRAIDRAAFLSAVTPHNRLW
jgi:hypothetical protein